MFSFDKLKQLLVEKNWNISKIFMVKKNTIFIELVSVTSGETFIIRVPEKYKLRPKDQTDVYKLCRFEMEDMSVGTLTDHYAGAPSADDVEERYDEVHVPQDLEDGKQDMNTYLEDKYKRNILLKDMTKDDRDIIKQLVRQMNRFKFCVQHISYKLCIIYNKYIIYSNLSGDIECFVINISSEKQYKYKRLHVVLDIKSLTSKIDIDIDIKTIKDGLWKILNKNQNSHVETLNILSKINDIHILDKHVKTQKQYYTNCITRSEQMLIDINKTLADLNNRYHETHDKYKDGGLHSDLEKTQVQGGIHKEFLQATRVRNKILETIKELKMKQENAFLSSDNIFFDNIIMLNAIITNINSLRTK